MNEEAYSALIEHIINSPNKNMEFEKEEFEYQDFKQCCQLITRLQNDLTAKAWFKVISEGGRVKVFIEVEKQ